MSMAVNLLDALREWAEDKLKVARENTGPVDAWDYQRDQGKIEILEELMEILS